MLSHDRLIAGRYRLGSRLGRGGMGEVRLGLDVKLGRAVAIKLLSAELVGDPAARERFQREAQSAARLNHPSIVAVFDSGEADDPVTGVSTPYIVMELVEGQTFATLLHRGDQPSTKRALQLMGGVLDALAHSHDAGIVHQDIKPGNVMLDQAGHVKVMDFGIARSISDTAPGSTPACTVLGSARYLSPEQARGEATDVRSDIYSSGCLLYELLTGRPPFIGDNPQRITVQHLHDTPVRPSQLNPQVDAHVDAIVLRALAKEPADRYQTAPDMLADVNAASERLAVEEAVSSAVPSAQVRAFVSRVGGMPVRGVHTRSRPRRAVAAGPSGRRRRAALATAAVTAVVFPLGGFGLYSLNQPGSAEAQGASLSQVLQAPKAQAEVRPGAAVTSSRRPVALGSRTPVTATPPTAAESGSSARATAAAKASVLSRAGGAGGVVEKTGPSPSATADVQYGQAATISSVVQAGQRSGSTVSATSAAVPERRVAHHPMRVVWTSPSSHAPVATHSPEPARHTTPPTPTPSPEPSTRPSESAPPAEPTHTSEPPSPVTTSPTPAKTHRPVTKGRAAGQPHGHKAKRKPAARPVHEGGSSGQGAGGSVTPVPQEHQKPAEQVSKVKHVKKAKQKHAKAAKQVTKAIQGRDHKRGNPDKAGKPATKGVKTHKPGQKPPKATTPAPVSGQAAPAKNGKGGHGKGRHKPKP